VFYGSIIAPGDLRPRGLSQTDSLLARFRNCLSTMPFTTTNIAGIRESHRRFPTSNHPIGRMAIRRPVLFAIVSITSVESTDCMSHTRIRVCGMMDEIGYRTIRVKTLASDLPGGCGSLQAQPASSQRWAGDPGAAMAGGSGSNLPRSSPEPGWPDGPGCRERR
jgi:hypothetical protein